MCTAFSFPVLLRKAERLIHVGSPHKRNDWDVSSIFLNCLASKWQNVRLWKNEHESLREESTDITTEFSEGREVVLHVLKILSDVVTLASCTATKVVESETWSRILNTAQVDRAKLCEVLRVKDHSALCMVFIF